MTYEHTKTNIFASEMFKRTLLPEDMWHIRRWQIFDDKEPMSYWYLTYNKGASSESVEEYLRKLVSIDKDRGEPHFRYHAIKTNLAGDCESVVLSDSEYA